MAFSYPQKVTYWTVSGVDGNGDKLFNVGIVIDARFKQVNKIVTDDKGEELKATHFIYSETLIPKLSLVALSDMGGVSAPPNGTRKVVAIIENDSMNKAKKMII